MNGEIIQMNKQKIIFETEDLEMATPSIVSRCGIVYLDSATIDSKLLVDAWLKNELPRLITDNYLIKTIHFLFEWLLEPCLNFVTNKCEHYCACSKMHLCISFLRLFKCMINDIK
jgi:dynein heavy chain, axonemal